jgi:transcriptional regulator with XRE-family HTH domain
MRTTRTTQVELSRLSGLHQPSISQFLNGRINISDEQLDRLLSCMGHRLEVVHTTVEPELTRSERRSWLLHRRLSLDLTRDMLPEWRTTIEHNLGRLERSVIGQPHERHLEQWRLLVESDDVLGIKRVLTGLDRESIEMREVSPLGGLLTDQQRRDVLSAVG